MARYSSPSQRSRPVSGQTVDPLRRRLLTRYPPDDVNSRGGDWQAGSCAPSGEPHGITYGRRTPMLRK